MLVQIDLQMWEEYWVGGMGDFQKEGSLGQVDNAIGEEDKDSWGVVDGELGSTVEHIPV